ncbi:MAG TPA: serine/threonine-protein kinase, partial [Pirellulales bacterium]
MATTPPNDDRTDHDSRLIDLLLIRHERLVDSALVGANSEDPNADGYVDASDVAAEAAELDDCLRMLEQARRETVVREWRKRTSQSDGSTLGVPSSSTVSAALSDAESESQNDDVDRFGEVKRIGRFEIVRELGRGGLGIVLLAYDPVLQRQVALKIPRPEALLTPNLRQRFRREAQAAARLTHPHIVPVYEVGTAGPVCFIAAAFVEGTSLACWLRDCADQITSREAAALVADLADAMHYAHSQGILHRDLKPANVLLETQRNDTDAGPGTTPATWVAKITDFGLAKIIDLAGAETRTGAIIGTPAYMSPEQAKADHGAVGPATDIYALGAILYELLTGRPVFGAGSDAETLRLIVSEEPVAPRRLNATCPPDLEAICLKCLEKEPGRRYASAGALADDLRRFLVGEPTHARPLYAVQRVMRWAERNRGVAALLATVASLLIGVATVSVVSAMQINAARLAAEQSAAIATRKANDERTARAEAERLRDESKQNLVKLTQREAELREQIYPAQFHMAHEALRAYNPTAAQRFAAQARI